MKFDINNLDSQDTNWLIAYAKGHLWDKTHPLFGAKLDSFDSRGFCPIKSAEYAYSLMEGSHIALIPLYDSHNKWKAIGPTGYVATGHTPREVVLRCWLMEHFQGYEAEVLHD